MDNLSRRSLLASVFVLPATRYAGAAPQSEGWTPIFNGADLKGWKASGTPGSFKVVDGAISADGPRSHLFHEGYFKNFELKAEVMTRPGANSGIYFHTRFQPDGFPEKGFEVQINNTHLGEGNYRERKKTGSLYGVRNVYKQLVPDNEWFRMHVIVIDRRVQVRVNDILVVDYVEPRPPVVADEADARGRVLGRGSFALQCHDANSKVMFRNLTVRRLPDDQRAECPCYEPEVDDSYRHILNLSAHNVPVVDYHVHLKGGWTLEQALENSRRLGIGYGIAVNCGKGFGVTDDASLRNYLASMKGQPAFVAMQAEGREWVTMFSPAAVAQFDYVFTDSMTWTDDNGRRMRLWIKEEVGEIPDAQKFMDTLVDRTVGILNHEPIDIYVNPTFLPDVIAPRYDELWTAARMDRVIEAAARNGVAVEINNRYRLPGAAFLKRAKAAGVKFSFGTNNADPMVGRLEYPLQMVAACGLGWQDIFIPKPAGQKPVEVRGFRS